MSRRSLPAVVACAIAASTVAVTPAAAQFTLAVPGADQDQQAPGASAPGQAQVIDEILVEGNQRIEADTVRAYLTVKNGDLADPEEIDRSLKSLFATGLFADVSIALQGDDLMVQVVENPIINRIAFEGNRRIEDEQLQAEVQLRPRQVYTRTKVQADVARVLDVYRRSGRYAVSVEPKVIQLDQNRVDLVFEIKEGAPTYIRRINFIGNERYSDRQLQGAIATREERWYRFFSSVDTYDPDRLTFDRELLRRFYLRQGYADFRVSSAVAELTPDQEGFFVTFTIDEGDRYRFGDTDINVTLPDVEVDALRRFIVGETGDWYNADEVEETVQAITDALGALGYAFVDVRPRVQRDPENDVINITYDIQEGPKVFVERIDITGNIRTLDKVVRREIQLVEGDAFNTARLRRSRERIRNLGFFETVEITNVPSEVAPDRTVVQVEVQEQSTGELSFGVGWSSSVGALFDVGIQERNLLGKGQDLKLNLTIAERRQDLDLSFTEPYFLDRPLAAGFDLFATERDLQQESSYDSQEVGGALRLGFRYNERLRQGFKYTLAQTSIENVDEAASRFVKQREGDTIASIVGQTLTYDRRDSIIQPTEGYVLRLANDLAGLGGDETFFRTTVEGAQYFPIMDDVVLSVRGTVGALGWPGGDVLFYRNFNLGGDNLRGFEFGGASPRDKLTDDVLGGKWIANGSVELRFPLGLPEELGLTGKAFSDFGTIGTPDGVNESEIDYASSMRLSAGVGVLWMSPLGPLSLDVAQPILKEDFDETEVFRFSFGTRF